MQKTSKKQRIWALVISIGIALLAGGIGALLGGGFSMQETLAKPPLAPPGWLFAPVWTILYTLMGIAAWLVWKSEDVDRTGALTIYVLQLIVNVLWPLFYFRLQWLLFAFFWILLLIALVAVTFKKFRPLDRTAGWLLIPYLVWLLFAAYLNLGYYILNR